MTDFGAGLNTIMDASFTLFKRILLHRQVIQLALELVVIPYTSEENCIIFVFLYLLIQTSKMVQRHFEWCGKEGKTAFCIKYYRFMEENT